MTERERVLAMLDTIRGEVELADANDDRLLYAMAIALAKAGELFGITFTTCLVCGGRGEIFAGTAIAAPCACKVSP